MVLAHSLIGVPLTYFIIKKIDSNWEKNYSPLFLNAIYFFGIVGSVFPDFDLILTFFIDDLNHRKLISHSLLPYLATFLIVLLITSFFKNFQAKIKLLNLVFFAGVLSHLIIDFLVGGISIFAPLTRKIYGFPIYFNSAGSDFFFSYFTSWYSLFEIIIILFSLKFILKLRNIFIVKYLPIFLLFTAVVMIFLTK